MHEGSAWIAIHLIAIGAYSTWARGRKFLEISLYRWVERIRPALARGPMSQDVRSADKHVDTGDSCFRLTADICRAPKQSLTLALSGGQRTPRSGFLLLARDEQIVNLHLLFQDSVHPTE